MISISGLVDREDVDEVDDEEDVDENGFIFDDIDEDGDEDETEDLFLCSVFFNAFSLFCLRHLARLFLNQT